MGNMNGTLSIYKGTHRSALAERREAVKDPRVGVFFQGSEGLVRGSLSGV